MGSTSINNGSYESLQDSEHDSLSNDTGGSDKSGIGNNNSTGTTTRLVSHEKQPSREDSLISAFNTSTPEPGKGDGTFQQEEVEIHFAEIPKEVLTADYVKANLLSKKDAQRTDIVQAKLLLAKTRKEQVRGWGAAAVKKHFIEAARLSGLPEWVMTFADIKSWWQKLTDVSEEDINRMQKVQYGWFDEHKKWAKTLEDEFMMVFSWKYSQKSVDAAQAESERPGLILKGCIEQTFSYQKGDFVKQIQNAGSKTHGIKVAKSRPKAQTRNENGKYIKLKLGDYTVQHAEKRDDDGKKVKRVKKPVCIFYAVKFCLLFFYANDTIHHNT
jgi:hypothetical protein